MTLDKYKYSEFMGSYVWFISIDDYYGGLECASYGKVVEVTYNPEDDYSYIPYMVSIETENGNIYETDYTKTYDNECAFLQEIITFSEIFMDSYKKLDKIFWDVKRG